MTTYIFLDDVRDPPDDGNRWVLVRDIEKAWSLLIQAWYCRSDDIVLSLDHDLGDNVPTGNDLVNKIERAITMTHYFRPKLELRIHSANPVGRQNMEAGIRSIYKFLGS